METARTMSSGNVKELLQCAIASGLVELKKLAGAHLPDGEFYNVPVAVRQNLPPCPPTNDRTEGSLGEAKQELRRSPNMNFHTMKGRRMFKSNETARDIPELKKRDPDIFSKAMREQRKTQKFKTKKLTMKEIGQKREEVLKQELEKKQKSLEIKAQKIEKLRNEVKPWDWQTFCDQREAAKLGDLRQQLQYRKKVLFPDQSKQQWALNISKHPRETLVKNLETALIYEEQINNRVRNQQQSDTAVLTEQEASKEDLEPATSPSIMEAEDDMETEDVVRVNPIIHLLPKGNGD